MWLRGRVFSHRTGGTAVRTCGTCAETLIDIRKWGSIQLEREESPGSGWGSDRDGASITSRHRHAAGCAGVGITSAAGGGVRIVLAKYLISEAIRAALRRLSGDRTGAHDLIMLEPDIEAREPLVRGALEAHATITLAVRDRRDHPTPRVARSGAGINRRATTFQDVTRQAKGTDHIAIRLALLIHVTDILLAGGAREAELETDTVTFQDVALAIGDPVIDEAARLGAERVLLVLADHERGFRSEGRFQGETEHRDRGEQLDGCHRRHSAKKPTHDMHLIAPFCAEDRYQLLMALAPSAMLRLRSGATHRKCGLQPPVEAIPLEHPPPRPRPSDRRASRAPCRTGHGPSARGRTRCRRGPSGRGTQRRTAPSP